MEKSLFSNTGFYISTVGITLVSVSMYKTLGGYNGILFIIGFLVCVVSIEIQIMLSIWKGTENMKHVITFKFICIVGIGLAFMIVSLMNIMNITDLFLFGIGFAMILNPLIRLLARNK